MIEYGVLRGKVVRNVRAEEVEQLVNASPGQHYKSNHYHIIVEAGGAQWRCPVNVKSQDGSEVWFKVRDAFTDHPILGDLLTLAEGLTPLPDRRPGRTLDFVREPLFDRTTMRHLPSRAGGANDDVQDQLELHAEQARAQADATVFVFGSFWRHQQFPPDKVLDTDQGVHDVHMNQGNDPGHNGDDGVYQDGGVIFHFPQTDRYVGIFLAFNSQVWFTDNQSGHRRPGYPEGPLAQGPEQPEQPQHPEQPAQTAAGAPKVTIIAALINPAEEDPGKETVTLFNAESDEVSLEGWKILDRQNKAEVLNAITLASSASATITLTGEGAQLSNRGGSIRLLDAQGNLVNAVTYSGAQAISGEIVQF